MCSYRRSASYSFCSAASESGGPSSGVLFPRVRDGVLDCPVETVLVPTEPAVSSPCSPRLLGVDILGAGKSMFLKGNSMTVGRSLWHPFADVHCDRDFRCPRGARLKWLPATCSECSREAGG